MVRRGKQRTSGSAARLAVLLLLAGLSGAPPAELPSFSPAEEPPGPLGGNADSFPAAALAAAAEAPSRGGPEEALDQREPHDWGPPVADGPWGAGADLKDQIESMIRRAGRNRFLWGIHIYSVTEKRTLYELNSDKLFSPASNVKLLTTAAALDRLGPDFRFQTRVGYEGVLQPDGVLSGHLVIQGRGDPDLADQMRGGKDRYVHLDRMARAVQEAGIQRIEGDVIGDDSYFSYLPHGRGWLLTDTSNYYGAPVSALSFNDNFVSVWFQPGEQVGDPVRVFMNPRHPFIRLYNSARTVEAASPVTLDFTNPVPGLEFRVWGELPIHLKNWARRVPLGDSALYVAALFQERLQRLGIEVGGEPRSRHSGEFSWQVEPVEIYVHESPPLLDIIAYTNKQSHNLYAEILLRTLGAEVKGVGVDWAGLEVVQELFDEAGVVPSLTELYDGSGLSRMNLITPRAQTMFLAHVAEKEYFPLFRESLAVAGRDGTLEYRMRGTPAHQRVFAKTGTLDRVVSLGGYVQARSGQLIAFSILVNDVRFGPSLARRVSDQVCMLLAGL